VLDTRNRHWVRQQLATGRFVITVEFASPPAAQPLGDALRPLLDLARQVRSDPRIDAIALTDRSRSDHDHNPIVLGQRVADVCGKMPIVHWAGKDRSLTDLERDLRRAESLGLETFLFVTGDKVRHPPADRPVRYLDSVHALHVARQHSNALVLTAAVCPFKYREEELLNQYLKACKKLRAGADFLITQVGWDMPKFEEARWFLSQLGYHAPLVAGLLFLTPPRSRRIRRFGLPGVVLTDELAQRLEEEARAPDGGQAAAYHRLALQVVGVRCLGYAGAQISGLHTYPKIARLLEDVESLARECPTPEAWWHAWQATLGRADGRSVQVAPADGLCLLPSTGMPPGASATREELARYSAMDALDHLFFKDGSPGARLAGPLISKVRRRSRLEEALLKVEQAIKEPLFGCQSCGFCRLPHTAYVCPEGCPKGLANGPCGGTQDNICEFGDRECIHNRIYRVSKSAGLLDNLEALYIPPVPEAAWGSCSWVSHFRGEGPRALRLPAPAAEPMRSASVLWTEEGVKRTTE